LLQHATVRTAALVHLLLGQRDVLGGPAIPEPALMRDADELPSDLLALRRADGFSPGNQPWPTRP